MMPTSIELFTVCVNVLQSLQPKPYQFCNYIHFAHGDMTINKHFSIVRSNHFSMNSMTKPFPDPLPPKKNEK